MRPAMKTPAQIRDWIKDAAREMIDNGHPNLARRLFDAADQIDMHLSLAAADPVNEVNRLRNVIKKAIPEQTNAEVQRWLKVALTPGLPIYQNTGRRIDAD
jgi:hypothetical protein